MNSPRTQRAAEEALRSTLEVIAALRAELGIEDASLQSPKSPGEVAPNLFLDDVPIPAPVGHRSPWHVAPQAATDSVAIPKPSRGVAQYLPTDDTDDDEPWSDDDVPRSPGEVGALRGDGSFRGFDDVLIPAPRPIAETDIDEMLLAEYERELEDYAQDDGSGLMRTESGTLIAEANSLIEQSQQTLMQLAEDGLREELDMADADLEAWESVGGYAEGFSPKAGWSKLELAEEFLAEGDAFMEEQRRRGLAGDEDSEEEYGPSPDLAPAERDAYLTWQEQQDEFEKDAARFQEDVSQIQAAFADAEEALRNPSFGMGGMGPGRATGLNGPVPLGQRPRPQTAAGNRASTRDEDTLLAVQMEIEALREELSVGAYR